ncbi:MAG: 6-bladed beta-propeller [Mangrovibacterium sp.]
MKEINLGKWIDNVKNVPLSTLAKDIQYIPLETNQNCLLGESPRIQLCDKEIFVATNMEHLYRFDKDGRFLNEIGRIGRGPGECTKMINYIIDEKERKVYINDSPFGEKIVSYDFNGNYLGHFKVKTSSMVIEPFNGDYILLQNMFYTHLEKGTRVNEIEIYSNKGKMISSFSSSADPSRKYGTPVIPAIGYTFQNIFHYKAPTCDTLFTFTLNTKIPKYFFNMGSRRRPEDADELKNRKIKNTVAIMDIWETPQFMFFTCTGEESRQDILFCKTESTTSNVIWKDKSGLEEDIAGGLPFWPYLFSGSKNEKILIDFVFPHELIAHTHSKFFQERCKISAKAKALNEMCSRMNESDNLIIRMVVLK